MLFNTYLCNHHTPAKWWWDLGHSSVHCLRCGFCQSGCRRLARKRLCTVYSEDRGIQVPMTLDHGNIVGTQCSARASTGLLQDKYRARPVTV
jgi:hypothetical protein